MWEKDVKHMGDGRIEIARADDCHLLYRCHANMTPREAGVWRTVAIPVAASRHVQQHRIWRYLRMWIVHS